MYYERAEPEERDDDSREASCCLPGHEDDHYLVDNMRRIRIGKAELREAANAYGTWTKHQGAKNG